MTIIRNFAVAVAMVSLVVGCLPKKKKSESPAPGPTMEAPASEGLPPSVGLPPCADGCDDRNECTEDTCVDNACVHTVVSCDDGNDCTADSCDPTAGCLNPPENGTSCDDGSGCTNFDTCFEGQCVGKAVNCDDGNVCTINECVEGEGCVAADNDGAACDDRDPCTLRDECQDRVCSGEWDTCDDGNVCTDDACESGSGCTNANHNGLECDDANACTAGDICWDGACDSRTAVDCDDNNPCTTDSCDPAIGCVNAPTSGACDDGSACTEGDECVAGACEGRPISCDDGNTCTADTCDAISGCHNMPTAGACDDGNACTTADTCSGTQCKGSKLSCKDGNQCTADSCDPSTGCVNTPKKGFCNDGDKCTAFDHCNDAGQCHGKPKTCNDGNECTTDSCDSAKGCKHEVQLDAPCDDGFVCTANDRCRKSGFCLGKWDKCDDDNVCTWDFCKPLHGCKHKNKKWGNCDDDNACTTADTCQGGSCGGKDVNCDDGNACTVDSCDAALGCVNTPLTGDSCDDGSACTTGDTCVAGECSGKTVNCDDGDQCTADSCDDDSGCQNSALTGSSCDDGDACTVKDHCTAGTCGGMDLNCDDGDQCTADSCDSASGCVNTAQTGTSCDDGSACTEGDTCTAGECAGSTVDCNDNNDCTIDRCNIEIGCENDAVSGTGCSDSDACTSGDVCEAGTCVGSAVNCDDGNQCTTDSCDPAVGCSNTAETGTTCDDGNACTGDDACAAGACGGTPVDCDDDNVCTTTGCDPATGCTSDNVADGTACDDGSVCTMNSCVSPVAERFTVTNAKATNASITPNANHGFWLPGFFNGNLGIMTFQPGSTFDILQDGSAVMNAKLKVTKGPASRIGEVWEGVLTWDYRGKGMAGQGYGGPKKELKSGHQPKSVTNTWRYFDMTAGTLYRVGTNQYADLVQNPPGSKFPFQLGKTANGKNKKNGASQWLTYTYHHGSSSTLGHGDINVDITPGTVPPCEPTDTCEAGECTGAPVDCDDGDTCTDDSCDAIDGCVHDSLATDEVCDGEDNDCDGSIDEGFGVGDSCDLCDGEGVTTWAYSNDAHERPVVVAGKGFVLSGATFADMFEHSFNGDDAYIDHFLDLMLTASGAATPAVLGVYGAYDAGDHAGIKAVLDDFADQGYVSTYEAIDVSAGAPLVITAADLANVDVVILDAAPDAPQANFFVLADGSFDALEGFVADGGTIVASAYTMVHWNNYLKWKRHLANVDLAQLFGGVKPDINYYVDSAWPTGALGSGGLIKTFNHAYPNKSTKYNPWFHFFWGLDLSDACTEPPGELMCAADGTSVCQ